MELIISNRYCVSVCCSFVQRRAKCNAKRSRAEHSGKESGFFNINNISININNVNIAVNVNVGINVNAVYGRFGI